MNEQAVLAGGVVFVVATSLAMLRLGARSGGGAWAAAWVCLYLSGTCAYLADGVWPPARLIYPVLGSSFPALLWVGARQFAGRPVPRWIAPATSRSRCSRSRWRRVSASCRDAIT